MGLLRTVFDSFTRLFWKSSNDAVVHNGPNKEPPLATPTASIDLPATVTPPSTPVPVDPVQESVAQQHEASVALQEEWVAPVESLPEEPAAVTGESDDPLSVSSPSPATPLLKEGSVVGEAESNGMFCAFEAGVEGGNGIFRVFTQEHECLYELALSSNVYNGGISSNGRLAALQTTVGPADDNNRLMLIDVESKALVFSVIPETRWADSYEFDEGTKHLRVILDSVGAFNYNASGKCLDQYYFDDSALNSTRFSEIIAAAEALLDEGPVTKDNAKIALNLAIKARSLGADKDLRWNVAALKAQGLAYEVLGRYPEALDCLVKATELKPRLGMKRKIDSLKSKIQRL